MIIVLLAVLADVVTADSALVSSSSDGLAVVALLAFDALVDGDYSVFIHLHLHLFS